MALFIGLQKHRVEITRQKREQAPFLQAIRFTGQRGVRPAPTQGLYEYETFQLVSALWPVVPRTTNPTDESAIGPDETPL